MISFDYVCTSISVVPNTGAGCMSQILFLIFLVGFFLIVVMNKKYHYMMDWLINKLGKLF